MLKKSSSYVVILCFIITEWLNQIKISNATVYCEYYTSDGAIANITCAELCCSGKALSIEDACCTRMPWNSGIYVGLFIPTLCFITFILVTFCYCILNVKSSVSDSRSSLVNVNQQNSTTITPLSPEILAIYSLHKDEPPKYNELYNDANNNNTANNNSASSATANAAATEVATNDTGANNNSSSNNTNNTSKVTVLNVLPRQQCTSTPTEQQQQRPPSYSTQEYSQM